MVLDAQWGSLDKRSKNLKVMRDRLTGVGARDAIAYKITFLLNLAVVLTLDLHKLSQWFSWRLRDNLKV